MHQVYMCSNLKYPFELQRIERIMACTNINSGFPSFYRIQLLQQGRSMKGENLWPCIKPRTACHKEQEDDEIKVTPGANIRVPPCPPPFTIRGGHGGVVVWKMNLSRGRLKCKKGRMMRTSLLWIQPCPFVGVGVQLVFGLQESTYFQQLSRLHMDSNLGVLLLHGKITKSTLRWIHPHVDTLSELVTITDFIQRCIMSLRIDCYLIML
jgi:hypothetical protein